ncbi:nucleoside transporter-domain-containing protein [Lipomyces tetrasporus]|uniref:Nucleoside transporter-domain-containing protein n=1 Tax=Lipomyces tetrasporus TaxID=54092 RepID=A0AAD7QMF8_9ASCO|nr:nucleoside transporter-domain-containing protein [Lipomyces tetrasporus]KAJ8097874.1 nucleoside transporter-domain-containing protein [Lipomyces tetrasporus]
MRMASSSDPASNFLLQGDERTASTESFTCDHDGMTHSTLDSDAASDSDVGLTKMQSTKESYDAMDYFSFLLIGIAMLWPWNCFLSAAAYFQERFKSSDFLRENFQSCIMTTSTITATIAMIVLSYQQTHAKYTFRVWIALVMNIINFSILALTSITGGSWAIAPYFFYLLVSVFFSALATSLSQNGAFAIANLFAPIYTQGIMVGQAVAGVLPSIAQILSVVTVEQTRSDDQNSGDEVTSTSSFMYFSIASGITGVALLFFLKFYRKQGAIINHAGTIDDGDNEAQQPTRRHIPLLVLFRKLHYLAFAVFYTFGVTMMFPVFASNILSVNYTEGVSSPSSWFRPKVYIPFAFLVWNIGDLVGRVICGYPQYTIRSPKALAIASLARTVFIPLFFLCNISGSGATISSDGIYIFLQLWFGITNGYVSSCGMMGSESFVEEDEKEAAGGFMGLALNLGLAAGSLCSFILVGIIL